MNDIKVRVATTSDLNVIHSLGVVRLTAPWSYAQILSSLEELHVVTLVAEGSNSSFLGFIMGHAGEGSAEIYGIAVNVEQQGCGIGQMLMHRFIKEARARDAQEVYLEVADTNHRARAFYEKFGFEKISTRKNYYSPGKHESSSQDASVYMIRLGSEIQTS